MNLKTIEHALHQHGYAKVAYEIMRLRGEYIPRDTTLREHILGLTVKVAQNRLAQQKIRKGLEAYRQVVEE